MTGSTFRKRLRKIAQLALKTRQSMGYKPWDSICVYDVAEKLGIEVRFLDIPSLEGMYYDQPPTIIISSLRPPGRQAFTCGHEIGHHILNHGVRVDQFFSEPFKMFSEDDEEFLAEAFSGFLLMPKTAVARAFSLRGWELNNPDPTMCYTAAGWLGVGYSTLINHMSYSLKILPRQRASELLEVTPKKIRKDILNDKVNGNLLIVDSLWENHSIDILVGDLVLLPAGSLHEGQCCSFISGDKGTIFRGETTGIGRFANQHSGWSAYVRVSRREYVGRSIFRHLEEPENE